MDLASHTQVEQKIEKPYFQLEFWRPLVRKIHAVMTL